MKKFHQPSFFGSGNVTVVSQQNKVYEDFKVELKVVRQIDDVEGSAPQLEEDCDNILEGAESL